MKNILLLLFILLTLAFSSCSWDKYETPTPSTPIVYEDLPAYSIFKKGTYWIYKDSATNAEDSVYVYVDTAYQYYQTGAIQRDGYYMYYECQALSFGNDTYHYSYSISMGNYDISNGHFNGVLKRKFGGSSTGSSYLMFNEFVDGKTGYYWGSLGAISYKGFYNTLNVNGQIFNNVVLYHHTKNDSEVTYTSGIGYIDPTTDFYIAKNIGIVKKKIVDTQLNTINKTYYLIRYHIVQ